MRAARQKNRIILTFNFLENAVVRRALGEILENYRLKPGEVDPRVAAVWYSTRGCQTAGMSSEETREWLEHLHGFRSANLALLDQWGKTLSRRQDGQYRLALKLDEAQSLLTVLNDHRLMLAARHDIGQKEMDVRSLGELLKLKSGQRDALYSIQMLASVMEAVLGLLAPEAAAWSEHLEPPPES